MYKLILENISGAEIWPMISLVIFFSFFAGVIVWAVFMKKSKVDQMAHRPLESDPPQKHGDH